MVKTTLVIMAAGIGSRFGGGIKQLTPVGPSGEIIMDYSIYDAIEAGFDEVVFIIRHDLEKDFKEIIGNRIEKGTETGALIPATRQVTIEPVGHGGNKENQRAGKRRPGKRQVKRQYKERNKNDAKQGKQCRDIKLHSNG